MRMRRAVFVMTVSVGLGIFASACTLASPTHITVEPTPSEDEVKTGDKAATGATPAAGQTCSGSFAKVDVSKLTACGGSKGKGHCYDKTKTPQPDGFEACPKATEVCVNDEILAAGGSPLKSCTSIIGKGGCVQLGLLVMDPALREQSKALKQDICDAGQVCSPCADPTHNGAPTPFCQPIGVFDKPGTCGAAAGATAATPAPSTPSAPCCTTNGKSNGICLAETAIPEAQRDDAPADSCSAGNKCVPAAFVSGTPTKCTAGAILGAGVCMDKCFNSMLSIADSIGILDGAGCGPTESCIPCFFLKDTGAPGCN